MNSFNFEIDTSDSLKIDVVDVMSNMFTDCTLSETYNFQIN